MGPSSRLVLAAVLAPAIFTTGRHAGASDLRPDSPEFFEAKIRPLLANHCYKCHSQSAQKVEGNLLLDSRQGTLGGGKHGPVLTPGDPSHSRMIDAVRGTDPDLKMPPKEKLSDQEIADLVEWVKNGAFDPRSGAAMPGNKIDYAAARHTWAFGPPTEHPVPAVQNAAWCRSPIDRYVLAKLEERGLHPAPPADRRTLIRRAYFDLIGLPPKPEEIDAFLNDPSPDAFAKVIDRLLASPQYGERWARHWLDVVRYTDSFDARALGTEGDSTFAYRYRDWVVKSLNQDMPYNQFIMNQVAGDLLPSPTHDGFNADGLIATSIFTIGNWPGGEADRRKMMTDIADDQVDLTGRAFLGLTLACARCHDHKFDPISQADYYGLAGIFLSTHFLPNPGSPATGVGMMRLPLAPPREVQRRQQYLDNLTALSKQLDQFTDSQYLALARGKLADADRYMLAALEYNREQASGHAEPLAAFASRKSLDSYLIVRWSDLIDASRSGAPAKSLLTKPSHNVSGIAGMDAWNHPDGREIPGVLANNTDKPVSITTLTLPPHTISIHPGTKTGVAVGWNSPLTGAVQIRGRVTDADPNGGDGIDWRIQLARGHAMKTLASGGFNNGSSQAFSEGQAAASLNRVDLRAGDALHLIVYPKADYTCDSTLVDLEIVELYGQKRVWNLVHDVVPDLLVGNQGNPHADSLGNAGVWEFFEAGVESAPDAATINSAFATWIDSVATHDAMLAAVRLPLRQMDFPAPAPSDRELEESAAKVRDALVAFDNAPPAGPAANDPDAKLYSDLTRADGPIWGPARKTLSQLPPAASSAVQKMSEGLAEMTKNTPPPIPLTFGLTEGGVPQSEYEGAKDAHLMIRGRYDRPGPVTPRGFPRLVAGDDATPPMRGSGRLELAQWLASAGNPMTAKVMANRIWQHHFGQGIVRTPGNFGKLGTPPSHPELLDWLALRFVENNWSIKQMHRMIMLSSTYQQSSLPEPQTLKADPDNLLLGRMTRQRLEAEPLRDALLAVTGSIDLSMGGPAFRDMAVPRRTLYLLTIRSDRSNYRMLFDAADPTGIVERRIDSTVAPQALFLLNDPFAIDRAGALADRAIREVPADNAARVGWLYRQLFGRVPTPGEQEIGLAAVKPATATPSADDVKAAWQQYCQVLLCSNEFTYID